MRGEREREREREDFRMEIFAPGRESGRRKRFLTLMGGDKSELHNFSCCCC